MSPFFVLLAFLSHAGVPAEYVRIPEPGDALRRVPAFIDAP